MTRASVSIPRRAGVLALALAVSLAGGCGGVNQKLTRSLGITGKVSAVAPQLIGPERLRVTLPARGARAVLGPVARDRGVTIWQTLDGVGLSFRGGVLVASRGLGYDLMSADVDGTLALLKGSGDGGYYPVIRAYLDGEDRTQFRGFQCRRATADGTAGAVGRLPGAARRIDERCVSPDRRVTNTYWLDAAGRVIGSRQWVGPGTEYMETELIVR